MVIFVVLFGVFGALILAESLGMRPRSLRTYRAKMRIALAAMFLLAALGRLATPDALLQMIPEPLPLRREALYLSGLFEALGAVGLLVPRLRRAAGLGLAILMIAVLPANINVAVNNLQIDGQTGSPFYQWARVLWQFVLIWLPIWATQPGTGGRALPADRATTPIRRLAGQS